ncbi:MAG: nuclear transport factor 2 family protein [Microbacteriaceae bacterium]
MLNFEDIEEIKGLKAKYFRYIDTKQWTALRSLFSDDARYEGLWATAEGPDAFVANIQRNLSAETFSAHYGFMPEIVALDRDTARGIWAMQDYLLWPVDSKKYLGVSVPGQRGVRGYGHYEEEYRRENGVWKISFLRLSRLRLDPITSDEPNIPDFPFVRILPDWLGEGNETVS